MGKRCGLENQFFKAFSVAHNESGQDQVENFSIFSLAFDVTEMRKEEASQTFFSLLVL